MSCSVDAWQYIDIAEFRAKATEVVFRNIPKISDVLARYANEHSVKLSHFKKVRSVYAEYFLYRHWSARTSTVNIRGQLLKVKKYSETLQSGIANLDAAALFEFSRVINTHKRIRFDPHAPDRGWTEVEALEMSDVVRAVEALSGWAEGALRAMDDPRLGRPTLAAKLRVTRLLAALYAELTGKEPYTRKNPTTEGGGESGAFRIFVNEIMSLVTDDVTDWIARKAKARALEEKEQKRAT